MISDKQKDRCLVAAAAADVLLVAAPEAVAADRPPDLTNKQE